MSYSIEVLNAIAGPRWVTRGQGDPARTHTPEHATVYKRQWYAESICRALTEEWPRRAFEVVPAPTINGKDRP